MDIHYNHKKIEKSLDMNGILISNVAVPEDFRGLASTIGTSWDLGIYIMGRHFMG